MTKNKDTKLIWENKLERNEEENKEKEDMSNIYL